MITNEMYEVHLQSVREVHIKISLLQNFFATENTEQVRKFRKIGEITGVTTGGSIDINANSAVRRTCSIDMVVTDSSLLISEQSKIWIDKLFKVEIGLMHHLNNKIIWFNKGIFAINNPSIRFNSTSKTLSLEGLDLMCTIDGTLGGILEIQTQIPNTASITDAIKTSVNTLGKISETNIYIEENPNSIPFDIEKSAGDSIYSILEEIKDLYMDWEVFFDIDGRFTYRKVRNRYVSNNNFQSDVISYNFLKDNDLAINYNLAYDFSNVKNKIIVYGKVMDDGVQIKKIIENTNTESPFNVNKPIGIIPHVFEDDKISTQEQATERANYEFWKHNNFNERVNVELAPIYFLDVNQLVEFNRDEIGLKDRYIIDSLSIPLHYSGTMQLTAHRVYQT